jgi:hypothetical protein
MSNKEYFTFVIKEFTSAKANLQPKASSNLEMGYIFEDNYSVDFLKITTRTPDRLQSSCSISFDGNILFTMITLYFQANNADFIKDGNTLSDDQLRKQTFDYFSFNYLEHYKR